jgi:sec-independent protein translocase protein TatA
MGLDNPLHIAFLVVILLLVFGAKRLPEIGRSLGSGMREFKQSITGETPAQQQPALGAGPQQPALESTEPAAPTAAEPAPVGASAPAPPAPPAPEQAGTAEREHS